MYGQDLQFVAVVFTIGAVFGIVCAVIEYVMDRNS